MRFNDLKRFSNLYVFTKESLRQIEPNETTLNYNLYYWFKKGSVVSLKKGLYIFKDKWDKEENKGRLLEFLANKMYEPSYLSCEYVMNKYGLLSEAVFNLTSISTRKTKVYRNLLGTFYYYSITPDLFIDYSISRDGLLPVYIAKKEKSVFDYLYLRFLKNVLINEKTIEELRINWEKLGKSEFLSLFKYSKLSRNKRIREVINVIKERFYA